MENVELTHSKRIGVRTAPISFSENRRECFVWTKAGRSKVKDGTEIAYFNCSGCRAAKRANGSRSVIVSVKFNITSNQWIDRPEVYHHICQPKSVNQVLGINVRRSVQAEVAAGTKETPATARVRIDAKIAREFLVSEEDFAEVRHAAIGSAIATESAIYRAKRKRFPSIANFQEYLAVENRAMRLTLRGSEAMVGDVHFGEQLLLYGDQEMLIFSSHRQQTLLLNCSHLICDGTFKYSPKGIKQIYRIFGLVRQTHATPLVTVLLMGKKKDLYKRMWLKVKESILSLALVNLISFANFDAEVAAYSSFQEVFPGVSVKLCSFHVKQGLYRKVQGLGLSKEYENDEQLRKLVRMLGALQITPILEWNACLLLLRRIIQDGNFSFETKDKLELLLQYYENTWLSRGEIFSFFGHVGPRTTNYAESYHSKQRLHFSVNSKLGHWAVAFRQLTHTEEMDAMDVFEGRQPPRRQRTDYSEITERLVQEKDKLLMFLSTDDGVYRVGQYNDKMRKYMTRIGRLMGISFADFQEVLHGDEEGAVLQEGLEELAPIFENPANINLFD